MSQVNTDLVADRLGTGPANLFKQWAAKAWANLNGVGTIAIRDSENVSSVTDIGVGNYSFNFTNAMANANYGVSGAGELPTNSHRGNVAFVSADSTVNSWENYCGNIFDGSVADLTSVSASIHGDLA